MRVGVLEVVYRLLLDWTSCDNDSKEDESGTRILLSPDTGTPDGVAFKGGSITTL